MKHDSVGELLLQWADEQPDLDVSALGVVVRLQYLGRLLGRRANRALKKHGLKLWEYDVLSVLRRQGEPYTMPATDLALAAHLSSGAMTTRIDGLEQRGLVTRQQNERDARSVLVGLSARGLRLIDEALLTRLADAEEALSAFCSPEQRRLAGDLKKLLAGLEARRQSPPR